MAFIPQAILDSNPENPIRTMEADSSWIRHIEYNRENQQLTVSVARGDVYRLDGVPEHLANDFFESSSKGEFYNSTLKGRFNGDILVSMKK